MPTWWESLTIRSLRESLTRALAGAAIVVFSSPWPATAQTVFINEIHYDNTGTDAGEAIEIAGPAGTNLTGWSVVLYNGANGLVYDTDTLSGLDGLFRFSFRYSLAALVHHEGTKPTKCRDEEWSQECRFATESQRHRENAGLRALDAAPRSGGSGTKLVR